MYEIWITPTVDVDYFLVESVNDHSLADDIMVSWLMSGYLVVVRNKELIN